MPQVTLYLDDDTSQRMRAAAKQAGVSLSQWVAGLVRDKTATAWPDTVVALAGAWREEPSPSPESAGGGADVPRERL